MEQAAPRELNEAQREFVECYERLERLLRERRDDLAPFEQRNAIRALAALWQVLNGLGLEPGQIYDLGA